MKKPKGKQGDSWSAKIPVGPISKMAAVDFLRGLVARLSDGQKVPDGSALDSLLVRHRLRRIADAIEGKVRWRKALKFPPDLQRAIASAAIEVDGRPSGVSVSEALNAEASSLAQRFNLTGQDDVEELRDYIAEIRKQQRKRERQMDSGKSEK